MSEKFDYQAKLGSLFDALQGIDLSIPDLDFPIRIGNWLMRAGVHNLQQLLAMSGDELMHTQRLGDEQRRRREVECIIDKLERFNANVVQKMYISGKQQEARFNIFKIAKIHQAEEIHTSIIAELINPRSEYHDHKQGQRFLDLFMETIGLAAVDFEGADVQTEVLTTDGRRMDMVISTGRFIVPFEVKIWAGDQPRQLADYYEFARQGKGDVPAIFYLTADGHKPSKQSRGDDIPDKALRCISFKNHILPWLDKCIETQPSADVLEIVRQLRDNIADNFNLIVNDSVLSMLAERLSSKNLTWTECPPEYLTFTLKKKGMLEFALRIKRESKGIVQLLIICGVEQEDGIPNYANAGHYISNHPEEFYELLAETFIQPFEINPSTAKSIWVRYKKDLKRSNDRFAEECYEAVCTILSACKDFN